MRVLCSENQHTGQPTRLRGIVVLVLESRETAYAKMLADRLKRSRGQPELEGNTIRHIKLKSELAYALWAMIYCSSLPTCDLVELPHELGYARTPLSRYKGRATAYLRVALRFTYPIYQNIYMAAVVAALGGRVVVRVEEVARYVPYLYIPRYNI